MLVVSNAYLEPVLRPLVPEDLFFPYLQRTIDLLANLGPVSPIFRKHREVLEAAQRDVESAYRDLHGGQYPPRYLPKNQLQAAVVASINGVGNNANTSFGSVASTVTGSGRGRGGSLSRPNHPPAPNSAGPDTPTFFTHPTSAHSSFGGR
jgi:hypothetical protein